MNRTLQNRLVSSLRRGFTLIELVVALSLALLVTSAAMEVYLLLKRESLRARGATEIQRNVRNLLSVAGRTIKMAGSGMPPVTSTSPDPAEFPGNNIPYSGATAPANTLGGPIIVGQADGVGLIGDFPRPDSNLTGLSFPAQAEGNQRYAYTGATNNCPRARAAELNATDATNHTTLINELTGGCLVNSGCNTTTASWLIPNRSYGANCTQSSLSEPTCPWGLNKYKRGEYFITVFPNRQFIVRRINADANFNTCCSGGDKTSHTHCEAADGQFAGISIFYEDWGGYPAGNNVSNDRGRNNPPVNLGWITEGENHPSLVLPVNRGWISTLERVFLRYDSASRTVLYKMCWGPAATRDANWRNINPAQNPCTLAAGDPNTETSRQKGGTDWVSIAENVSAFQLTYYDIDGAVTTAPGTTQNSLNNIGAIGVRATIQRTSGGRVLAATQESVFQMRARRFR